MKTPEKTTAEKTAETAPTKKPMAPEATQSRQPEADAPATGYLTRDMKADQARIVADVEAMSAIPCTPTQEELNQAMADLSQVGHVTVDDSDQPAKKAD